jgi:hypothetical protein
VTPISQCRMKKINEDRDLCDLYRNSYGAFPLKGSLYNTLLHYVERKSAGNVSLGVRLVIGRQLVTFLEGLRINLKPFIARKCPLACSPLLAFTSRMYSLNLYKIFAQK